MQPVRAYKGYIFDCDGTLADSMPIHHEAWVWALKKNGASFHFEYAQMCTWGGKSMEQTVLDLNALHQVSLDVEAVVNDQAERVKAALGQVKPRIPIVRLARQLAEQASVSVASGGHREHVHLTIERIGLKDLFEIIVTQNDVTHSKPAPDLFFLAAEKMGVPAEDCLVYEDSDTGVAAAHAAGMDCIRV